MPEILEYDFRVIGLNAVNRALASVERRFVEHNRKMTTLGGSAGGLGGKGGGFRKTAAQESREAANAQRMMDRANRAADLERTRADVARLRSFERAELEKTRTVERETRKRAAAEERAARQSAAAAKAAARKDEASRARFRSRTAGSVTGAFGHAAGTVGRFAVGAGTILGGIGATAAVGSQMRLLGQASALANQAGMPGRKGEILNRVQDIRGVTAESGMGALEGWQTLTGELNTGLSMLPQLAKTALATGSDLTELTQAAGNAFNTLGQDITDPVAKMAALDNVMRTIAAQGAIGAVELKDLAREMAGMAATAAQFAGGTERSIQVMGAMAQVARSKGGAGSAAEAITSLERFASDLVEKSSTLKAMGINVWTPKGQGPKKLRRQEDIMVDILTKTSGDPEKIAKVFGIYGKRAVGGFGRIYQEAEAKKPGAGAEAVRAEFNRFLDVRTGEKAIQERYQSRLEDPDIKAAEALKEFNKQVGTQLLPVITKMIPEFTKLIPLFTSAAEGVAKFVGWVAENPYKGLGVIISGLVAKDLAAAGIGAMAKAAIEVALTTSLGGGLLGKGATAAAPGLFSVGGAGTAAGGMSKGAAALGTVGLSIAVGTATFAITSAVINGAFSLKEEEERKAGVEEGQRGTLISEAEAQKEAKGELSGDMKKRLKAAIKKEEDIAAGKSTTTEFTGWQPGPNGTMVPTMGMKPVSEAEKEDARRTADQLRKTLETPSGQLPDQGFGVRDTEYEGGGVATSRMTEGELTKKTAAETYGDAGFADWIANMQAGSDSIVQLTTAVESAAKKLNDLNSPNRSNSPTVPR